MKWIIWTIGGALAAGWTVLMALSAQLVDWAAAWLQQAGTVGSAPALPAMPAVLQGWLDPAAWAAWVTAALGTVQGLQGLLPALGTVAGWLVPLVWFCWGVGMLTLLVMAGGAHWLAARRPSWRPA